MSKLEETKLLYKQSLEAFQLSGSDSDYEACLYAKRQMCKCEQIIQNLKNKRLEELKKDLSDEVIREVFPEPVVEVVSEPVP